MAQTANKLNVRLIGLSLIGLLVIGALIWIYESKPEAPVVDRAALDINTLESRDNNAPAEANTVESDNNHRAIPGEKDFYEKAFIIAEAQSAGAVNKGSAGSAPNSDKEIVAGIIPHHLLAADLIAGLFTNFSGREYDSVVLLGPNHFSAGNGKVITSLNNWDTPYGVLEADTELAKGLVKKEIAEADEEIFKREHAIYGLVSFIKKSFPEAKFLPLVLRPSLDGGEAANLAEAINSLAKGKKVLVLASVDFSHETDSETAKKNDRQSIEAIGGFKLEEIYKLKLDSSPAIYALMRYAQLKKANFSLVANSNSAELSGQPEIKNATSYVTGLFWYNKN